MNFNTTGQELPTQNQVSKYINALTITEATLTTEAIKSTQKGTPGLKFTFTTDPVEGLNDENGQPTGQTADTTFYITETTFEGKTVDYNGKKVFIPGVKEKLMMLADGLGVREQFDLAGASATSVEDYTQKVAQVLTGKARFKFGGEEIAGKDGKPNWNKAVLARYGFVESLTVPQEQSKLKVTEKDLKKLVTSEETVVTTTASATDLY